METGTWKVKTGLAQMLKGGVIMDVVTAEQAKIAEEAGACAVMALERVPADIRAAGGVARMADPTIIEAIMKTVSIPVMAKCRIGHFVEAQVLQALGVDYIDESEVLTPADEKNHVWKHDFTVPFVCGCRDLGEALRRIGEGAAMITPEDELMAVAKEIEAPFELVSEVHKTGKLPVVNFAAGGVATPSDAALMMQLGADGVFVGSGIFKSSNPEVRARAIVKATTHYQDPKIIAEVSKNLGEAMPGLDIKQIPSEELLAQRGW